MMDSTLCFKHSSFDGGEKSLAQKPLAALHISLHFSSYFQIEDFSLVTKPIALSGAGFFTKFMSPPFILYLATPFPQCFLLSSLQELVKTMSHLDYSAKPAVHSFHWY